MSLTKVQLYCSLLYTSNIPANVSLHLLHSHSASLRNRSHILSFRFKASSFRSLRVLIRDLLKLCHSNQSRQIFYICHVWECNARALNYSSQFTSCHWTFFLFTLMFVFHDFDKMFLTSVITVSQAYERFSIAWNFSYPKCHKSNPSCHLKRSECLHYPSAPISTVVVPRRDCGLRNRRLPDKSALSTVQQCARAHPRCDRKDPASAKRQNKQNQHLCSSLKNKVRPESFELTKESAVPNSTFNGKFESFLSFWTFTTALTSLSSYQT